MVMSYAKPPQPGGGYTPPPTLQGPYTPPPDVAAPPAFDPYAYTLQRRAPQTPLERATAYMQRLPTTAPQATYPANMPAGVAQPQFTQAQWDRVLAYLQSRWPAAQQAAQA